MDKDTEKHTLAELKRIQEPCRSEYERRHRKKLARSLRAAAKMCPEGLEAFMLMSEGTVAYAAYRVGCSKRTLFRKRRDLLREIAWMMGWAS